MNPPSTTPGLRRATDRPKLLARSTSGKAVTTIEVEPVRAATTDFEEGTIRSARSTPRDVTESDYAAIPIGHSVADGLTQTITVTEQSRIGTS